MKLVLVESPFSGDRARNLTYLKDALHDCLERGEAPFASHGFYPSVLNDDNPEERELGMECGFLWGAHAEVVAIYYDLGISRGMQVGIKRALVNGQEIQLRTLPGWASTATDVGALAAALAEAERRKSESATVRAELRAMIEQVERSMQAFHTAVDRARTIGETITPEEADALWEQIQKKSWGR